MENKIICNCKQVSVADIEEALHKHERFSDVENAYGRIDGFAVFKEI